MDEYKVRLLRRAYKDLDSIYSYISYEKLAPYNAREQIDRIKDAILELKYLPQSHQDRLSGRYADRGYKQLIIDSYIVIFRIDESEKIVWIVTIQYQGRNL